MQYPVSTTEEYLRQIPKDRLEPIKKLIEVITDNLPPGFEKGILYKMLGWYVPFSRYPEGYHCDPKTPLPFINLASQKNFSALYHSGIYAKTEILDWFVSEYPKHCKRKLDMGKSCIRFKYIDDIPYDLIGELCQKLTVDEWIKIYESSIKK